MQTIAKSRKFAALLLVCLLALALAFAFGVPAFAATSTSGESSSSLSDWLDDYSEFDEELLAKDRSWNGSEMNPADDSVRTFDYGVRIPTIGDNGEFTSYLGGNSIDAYTPGAYIGNGMTVDENTAKLALKSIHSSSGSARFRYAYPVELDGLTVDHNFADLATNDHICIIYSGNYNSFRHSTAVARGLTLTYYDDPTAPGYIKINFGLSNTAVLNGMDDIALPVDDSIPESYSVKTIFDETDSQLIVTVANGGANGQMYTVTIDKSELGSGGDPMLEDEAGRTWINLTVFNDTTGDDISDTYALFTMRVTDSLRTAYESETLNPLTTAMAAYTAEGIEGAAIEDIGDVDEWVAKRDAVTAAYTTGLRISDRAYYAPDTAIANANAALQTKAGTVVDAYLTSEISALRTSFEEADGDTTYTQVTQQQYGELSAAFAAIEEKVNTTYAGLYTGSLDTAYLATAEESLERVDLSLAIAALEGMPLTSPTEVTAAREAYNQQAAGLTARIEALSYESSVKDVLTSRLTAVDTNIQLAEGTLDPADLADSQIKNYEAAASAAETLDDIYSALALRALISDYSSLDGAAAFAARVETADGTLAALAWALVEERVETIETLSAAGVNSYSEKAALSSAIAAISDRDLLADTAISLAEANKTRFEEAVTVAEDLIEAWQTKLAGYHVNLQNQAGTQTDSTSDSLTNDVELTDDGLLYTFTGDQSAIMFNEGYDIYEGITMTFSVRDWAFLTNDGSGYTSNNVWLYWTNNPSNNRGQSSISIMFWNYVGTSDVKVYYETDTEENMYQMSTFGEDDGSYVVVRFSVNTDRHRYEINVDYYSEDGSLLDTLVGYLSYTEGDTHDPANLFPEGKAYMGIACYMTHQVGTLNNELYIRSVGDTDFTVSGGDPTDPENPGTDPENPENPGTDPEEPTENGLTPGAIAGIVIACVVVVAAVIVAVVLVKRKNNKK